jgi:cysteinyl-tRNA synthetase
MAIKYLGEHFDLHTGGVDNIFPHHEDEIAQSEGFTGKPFVNYWVHAQHLLADGQKMAKSTGNAYTRTEIEARGFHPLALRYFYTTALYRARLNFTFQALQAAQTALERLQELAYQLYSQAAKARLFAGEPVGTNYWKEAFLSAVENDLNMPRAMAVVWSMLRAREIDATTRVRMLLDFDRILGFNLKGYLQSEEPERKRDPRVYLAAVPAEIAELVRERDQLRERREYASADRARRELSFSGYMLRDTERGPMVMRRRREEEFIVLSKASNIPDFTTDFLDRYEFSVNLLAHNSRADLERCIESIRCHAGQRRIELVIIDNGSTDDTLAYLEKLERQGGMFSEERKRIDVRVLFADHDIGFGAGRNATMRTSQGRYVLLMDTSMEVNGDIWEPLEQALADSRVGVVGPYGLVSGDLREFREDAGPDVDAIEGYLMAFRRALLPEVGWMNEKFRFYRLLDVHFSFFCKTAGYFVRAAPIVAERMIQHPHHEWHSLSEDERATKSKKNFDIFYTRWHHGQSLLVANYRPEDHWHGHDHAHHLGHGHRHPAEELPPPGVVHTHKHQHWPDHDHEHPHMHYS